MRPFAVALAGALLLPLTAAAAGSAGPTVLNLATGVPEELLVKTLSIARYLFALAVIVALVAEAFGGSPVEPKNYGGLVMRALVVFVLLGAYRQVFGTVVQTTQNIAARVSNGRTYGKILEEFAQHHINSVSRLKAETGASKDDRDSSGVIGPFSSVEVVGGYFGGVLFDGLVLVLVTLGQAVHWTFLQLTAVMIALLYVLGPLALILHIPATAGVAGRWFRSFATVCCWPIITGALMALSMSLFKRTDEAAVFGNYSTAFGGLATTTLMVAMTLATPLLASSLIGGSLKNVPAMAMMTAGLGAVGAFGAAQAASEQLKERFQKSIAPRLAQLGNALTAAPSRPLVPLVGIEQTAWGPTPGGVDLSGVPASGPAAGSASAAGVPSAPASSAKPAPFIPSFAAVPMAAEPRVQYGGPNGTVNRRVGGAPSPPMPAAAAANGGPYVGAPKLPRVGGIDTDKLRREAVEEGPFNPHTRPLGPFPGRRPPDLDDL